MKRTLWFVLLVSVSLWGDRLIVDKGVVHAHTEVFGDSTIDPETHEIISHLTMNDTPETMRGSVDVNILKLQSDNKKRDEHMVEKLESKRFPFATYTFKEVVKNGNGYDVKGVLNFHGVSRPLSIHADISQNGNIVRFKGKSHINISDYGVKPIKLLFLTVRDRVDLNIDVTFKKRN